MTNRSDARTQFLSDMLATALEGGINYWATIVSTQTEDAPNDPVGWRYTHAVIRETEEGGTDHHVNLDRIASGLNALCALPGDHLKNLRAANRTNGQDGDYDATDADQALQFGLFGKSVYA